MKVKREATYLKLKSQVEKLYEQSKDSHGKAQGDLIAQSADAAVQAAFSTVGAEREEMLNFALVHYVEAASLLKNAIPISKDPKRAAEAAWTASDKALKLGLLKELRLPRVEKEKIKEWAVGLSKEIDIAVLRRM